MEHRSQGLPGRKPGQAALARRVPGPASLDRRAEGISGGESGNHKVRRQGYDSAHRASLVLSVFQDPRSAESLLQALAHYPLGYTKIRENLIYTLGNLKEVRAVDALIEVLEAADEIKGTAAGRPTACLLLEHKGGAIWGLGTTGLGAVKAIPVLARTADQ